MEPLRRSNGRFDPAQYLDDADDVHVLEYAFHTVAVEIGEGRFIKQFRVHHAARGEMIDHETRNSL